MTATFWGVVPYAEFAESQVLFDVIRNEIGWPVLETPTDCETGPPGVKFNVLVVS